MASEYISREAALKQTCFYCSADIEWCNGICDDTNRIRDIPAADVRPVAEISDAVDEALDFLSSVHAQMPYHVYSALFDLICGICPSCDTDMREAKSDA